ncbi:MAG: calcium-translocating P-type ATPase, PMCA-type [Ruminococcaceae bacterium]|nr:calcium-translocating P-type ATPase, PMCA-type [Oscillospiraceae bacterium]
MKIKEKTGLNEDEVLRSREKYGDNSLVEEKSKGFVRRFFENLNDPIIKVLIFALIIEVAFTFGRCNFFEVFGIVCAILIATTVSTASECGSEKVFQKMKQGEVQALVRVLRSGEIREISVSDIVVGDIVFLSAGEKIHADGFILSGTLKVDQSALNGESRDAEKYKCDSGVDWDLSNKGTVFRGTVVVSGEAVMRVGRVGITTYYGMVARDVQSETRESPLKLRLRKFATQISKIGYIMAAIVAITYLFNTFVADNGFVASKILESFRDIPFLISSLIHALTLMITVVVVAAPEGLPMMITVVLSANMKKMFKDGVLVKKLVGIETAGSMNILFTDKTGTLTVGKPECDYIITVSGISKNLASLKKSAEIYNTLCLNAKYNTDVTVSSGKIIGGNGTDRALAELFKNESAPNVTIVEKNKFTSEKKISSIVLENRLTLIKGAPEIIISNSTKALDDTGNIVEFQRRKIEDEYLKAAEVGNRIIGIATKTEKEEYIFVALVVMKDKIRRGVKESVRGVKRAGVQVVMMTGDGKATATAIARECGIMGTSSDELVITSSELNSMSDEEVKKILKRLRVLARALPQDKTRLVRLSQEEELVVGMTGDGVNDAPSLKLADIGFAMGNAADIAKGAGDIILVNNSFFSINRTILYGRTIFKSIRKFITFQLIMNLTACGVSLFGQFLGIDSPITIIQMLWVNIIMDTLGGLAFAGEPPHEYYMLEKPKSRDEAILSPEMIHQISFTGAFTLIMCISFLKMSYFHNMFRVSSDDIYFMTGFYALFIFSGIFNCFGARCERMWMLSGITKNKPFTVIMISISVIQLVMIYFGGSVFRTLPLNFNEILRVILLASSVVPFEMIRRIMYRLKRR